MLLKRIGKAGCITRNVTVRAAEKRIFDIHPDSGTSDFEMIKDAYHTCHPIKDKGEMEACYFVLGFDSKTMEYYYPVVYHLEKMYYKSDSLTINLWFTNIKIKPKD